MKTLALRSLLGSTILSTSVVVIAPAMAQDPGGAVRLATLQGNAAGAQAASADSVEGIEKLYEQERRDVEKKRLERIGRLAASLSKDQADPLYRSFFEMAIGQNLFAEAEPVAEQLIKSGNASARTLFYAQGVNLISEVDRGAYEQSLASLHEAIRLRNKVNEAAKQEGQVGSPLPLPTRLSLLELYYQRLVQSNQFEVARKAFQIVNENADDPTIKEFTTGRLSRLNLLGKAAPPIVGKDLDGKNVNLADFKGSPVLVIFWASWCLPNAQEIHEFQSIRKKYSSRACALSESTLTPCKRAGRATSRSYLMFDVSYSTTMSLGPICSTVRMPRTTPRLTA